MNEVLPNDSMPAPVATALLTSPQSMTARFRKVCERARERVIEPVSCSTQLSVSAPRTYGQQLILKLRKMNARQLCTWSRRVTRRGERLQDSLFAAEQQFSPTDADADEACGAQIQLLKDAIEQLNMLGQAIKSELDRRASAGRVNFLA